MKLRIKNIILFIGILLLFLSFEIVFLLFDIDIFHLTINQSLLIILIKDLFFVLLFIILYHKYLKEKWIDFKNHFKPYLETSFKYWITGYIIMIISNYIINMFTSNLGQNENQVQEMISYAPFITFIFTTILAPFIEEMIFRKSLKDCFNSKLLFMIISGLLFGYVHVMSSSNPLEYLLIIPYGSLGFMFAKTLNETDNIYCTIMMHMFHNGVLTLLSMVI